MRQSIEQPLLRTKESRNFGNLRYVLAVLCLLIIGFVGQHLGNTLDSGREIAVGPAASSKETPDTPASGAQASDQPAPTRKPRERTKNLNELNAVKAPSAVQQASEADQPAKEALSDAEYDRLANTNELWLIEEGIKEWTDGLFSITSYDSGKPITYWAWNRPTIARDFENLHKQINDLSRQLPLDSLTGMVVAVGFHGTDENRPPGFIPGGFYADATTKEELTRYTTVSCGSQEFSTQEFLISDLTYAAAAGPPYTPLKKKVFFLTPDFGQKVPTAIDAVKAPFEMDTDLVRGNIAWYGKWASVVNAGDRAEHVILSFCLGSIMTPRKQKMMAMTGFKEEFPNGVTNSDWTKMDVTSINIKMNEMVARKLQQLKAEQEGAKTQVAPGGSVKAEGF